MAVRQRVLIIDTGANGLVRAAEAAARDLGHLVYTHTSTIGVGGALATHDVEAVVLVWDLPQEQDHKLLALVETWERFRALTTVVVAVTRALELSSLLARCQGARVIEGVDLSTGLAHALSAPAKEKEPETESTGRGESSQFVSRLRKRLTEAAACWESIAQGTPNHREMEFLLGAAQGQAQLIHLDKLMAVLSEVRSVARVSAQRKHPSPEQYEAVTSALSFAVHATLAPPYDADRDVQPMLQRLRKSQNES